ncbi:carboxypeptidase-like regulatory domain-containing protein [Flavisolibacter nicotianae]|uniref:carboxypeptidase-like regulatory domain-containing protein n=1 Tax=Flavisolibacter nicotianae TaxID=2364882 RepID=UPI000EB5135F|nr:carboxypeptidase-like regulatory domain-containing protein [Flavisolibacter nicotianae]
MKKYFFLNRYAALLAITAALSFSSCAKDPSVPPTGGGTAEANMVSGLAVDAQGKPMAGVKIRAENPTGDNIHVDGTTGADGRYKLKLSSIGGWKIYAWKEVEYQDKVYHLRLGMKSDADYDAFATDDKAVVKDFVWKLSGRIPDRSASYENGWGYFGASLRLVNYNDLVPVMPAGTKVTVTLTPVGGAKYLDGTSATAPVVKTFTIQTGNSNYYLGDIPVTEYRISAESVLNGVIKKVFVGANSSSNLAEWLEFYFDPAASSTGSYESGLKSPGDYPFYLGRAN